MIQYYDLAGEVNNMVKLYCFKDGDKKVNWYLPRTREYFGRDRNIKRIYRKSDSCMDDVERLH